MRTKLSARAERSEDVEPVLAQLKEYGYLNDQTFSAGFASFRKQQEGHGKMRVLRDLRARRVSPAVAEQAVADAFQGTSESELVRSYLARKYRSKNLSEYLQEDKHLASAYRRLRHAGFSHGPVMQVLLSFTKGKDEVLGALETEPPEDAPF